ncbi:MAG: DUF2723 domain-containing protein [Spirochaetia bacterium]|nr:DUF2723 domain-containing protein [Spirochaetia bacterium]
MKYVIALLTILLSALYINTAPPTIYMGDSGLMVSAASTLGICHPPGYPIYVLTGKLFSMVPLGDAAFRLNLMAIALSTLAFVMFCLTAMWFVRFVFSNTDKKTAFLSSVAAGLVYFLSPQFWLEAVHAKGAVYIMLQLCVITAFYTLFRFISDKKLSHFYLTLFLCGFMLPIHNSATLYMLFIAAAAFMTGRGILNKRRISYGLLFFSIAAFTPYLYLFIRVRAQPVVLWGDIATVREVMGHIMRETYNYNRGLVSSPGALLARLGAYAGRFVQNYHLMAVLSATAFVFLLKRSKTVFYAAFGLYLTYVTVLIYVINTSGGLKINDISAPAMELSRHFLLAADIVPMLAAAAGVYGLIMFLSSRYGLNRVFLSAMVFLAPAFSLLANYEPSDQSRKFMGYDHAVDILTELKPGEILQAGGDCPVFNILYVRTVLKKFPDIKIYDIGGTLLDHSIYRTMKRKWYRPERNELLKKMIIDNPGMVYRNDLEEFRNLGIYSMPYGLLYRMGPAPEPVIGSHRLMELVSYRDLFNNRYLDTMYTSMVALRLIAKARYESQKPGMGTAMMYLKEAEKIGRGIPGLYTAISSVYYYNLRDTEAAVRYLEKAIEANPYDFDNLDLLIKVSNEIDPDRALYWMKYFHKITPSKAQKESLKASIKEFEEQLNAAAAAQGGQR